MGATACWHALRPPSPPRRPPTLFLPRPQAHYAHIWTLHGMSMSFLDAMLLMDMRTILVSGGRGGGGGGGRLLLPRQLAGTPVAVPAALLLPPCRCCLDGLWEPRLPSLLPPCLLPCCRAL